MYNTVVFDLDGTLLNTLEDLADSTNYALEKNGFPKRTIKEVRRFVGNGIRKLIERAVPDNADNEAIDKTFADFKAHYEIHCNDKTAPYDGIMELINTLHKSGYKIGIASNKARFAVVKLNEIYFDGLMDDVAGADENTPTKPSPDMVEDLLNRLGATKENTLYVGDSQVDVATARNTGLNMVAVLWGFRDRKELEEAGARHFIEKPEELLDYL